MLWLRTYAIVWKRERKRQEPLARVRSWGPSSDKTSASCEVSRGKKKKKNKVLWLHGGLLRFLTLALKWQWLLWSAWGHTVGETSQDLLTGTFSNTHMVQSVQTNLRRHSDGACALAIEKKKRKKKRLNPKHDGISQQNHSLNFWWP